jgi:hypothetical protein
VRIFGKVAVGVLDSFMIIKYETANANGNKDGHVCFLNVAVMQVKNVSNEAGGVS